MEEIVLTTQYTMVNEWYKWLRTVYRHDMVDEPMGTLIMNTSCSVKDPHSAKDIVGAWATRVFPDHDVPSHLVIASALTLDHIWADHPGEMMEAAQVSRETVYMLLAFEKDARTLVKGLCSITHTADEIQIYSDPKGQEALVEAYLHKIATSQKIVLRSIDDPIIVAAWSKHRLHSAEKDKTEQEDNPGELEFEHTPEEEGKPDEADEDGTDNQEGERSSVHNE
jgi:hypothetical protein